MDTTILLARIFSLLFIVAGIGALINRKEIDQVIQDYTDHHAIAYMVAVMTLVSGLLMVLYHHVWVGIHEILITLLGWSILLYGFFMLLFPALDRKFVIYFKERSALLNISLVFGIVFGLYLAYFGFMR